MPVPYLHKRRGEYLIELDQASIRCCAVLILAHTGRISGTKQSLEAVVRLLSIPQIAMIFTQSAHPVGHNPAACCSTVPMVGRHGALFYPRSRIQRFLVSSLLLHGISYNLVLQGTNC